MSSPPSPPERAELPEPAALTQLALRHPELAPAVALEREIFDGERRLQRRLGTPWIDMTPEALSERIAKGERLIEIELLGLDWPELRLRLRQVIDVLRRHDVLDGSDSDRFHAIGRTNDLPTLVRTWFDTVPGAGSTLPPPGDGLGDVIGLAVRPFLTRAADVLMQRVSLDAWSKGTCPMCGAPPTFAVLAGAESRQLVCGRCRSRWRFERRRCHHCLATDRLREFSVLDGVYCVTACDGCRRYLKALDPARAGRQFIASVDIVTTLALDHAVAEQGFVSTGDGI